MPNFPVYTATSLDRRTTRADDLIEAYLAHMAASGIADATARTVAARAGVSASAINYHFDSIERLYGVAQQQAVDRTRAWLRARLGELIMRLTRTFR